MRAESKAAELDPIPTFVSTRYAPRVYPYGPPPPQQYPPQWGPPPYGAAVASGPPAVWPWYIAYVVAMTALYALVFAGGVLLALVADNGEDTVQGVIMAVVGVPFTLLYGAGLFLPKRPWAWTYHLVLIGLSTTSGCCLPVAVPLIIHWTKPETKAFFGRL